MTRQIIRDPNALDRWIENAGPLTLDTETTGLLPFHGDRMIGLPLHDAKAQTSIYVPLRHRYDGDLFSTPFENAPLDRSLEVLRDRLPALKASYWNLPFDVNILSRDGIQMQSGRDILLHARIVTAGEYRGKYGLKEFAKHLGAKIDENDRLKGWLDAHDKDMGDLIDAPPDLVAEYAMADAELTSFVDGKLDRTGVEAVCELEDSVAMEVARMEQAGVAIDRNYAARRLLSLADEMKPWAAMFPANTEMTNDAQLRRALESAGVAWPIDPETISQGAPDIYRTDGGKPALDELTLMRMNHPLATAIIEWRYLAKGILFLGQVLTHAKESEDGRVHPDYQPLVRTGRMTCKNPNFQQMPAGKDLGVRAAFVAPPGYKLWLMDFDQLQLRLISMLSGDRAMQDVFRSGGDIHDATRQAMGIEERRPAKIVNFTQVFGGGEGMLADQMFEAGVSPEIIARVGEFRVAFNRKYPMIYKSYFRMKDAAIADPWVRINSGRKRKMEPGRERAAINTAIQMWEADCTKAAFVKLGPAARALGGWVSGFVHDEFHVVLPEDMPEEKVWELVTLCEDRSGAVPITVSLAMADPSWGAKRELKNARTHQTGSDGDGSTIRDRAGVSGESEIPARRPPGNAPPEHDHAREDAGRDSGERGGTAGAGRVDPPGGGVPEGSVRGPGPGDGWSPARLESEHACAVVKRRDGSLISIICCDAHRGKAVPKTLVLTADYVARKIAARRR